NRVVLCLAWDTKTGEHETWALDAAKLQWRKMSPAVEPVRRRSRSRNLSFIAEHNLFILETSAQAGKGRSPEIWTYRYEQAPANTLPPAPTELQALTSKDVATLSWQASAAPVKEYRVYRSQPEKPWEAKFERMASVPGPTFEDTKVERGNTYTYQMR